MQIGMVGLGKMGANMSERLIEHGHAVVGFDPLETATSALDAAGGTGVRSLGELVEKLDAPRAVWIMVPAGPIVDATLTELQQLLSPGDLIVDGGNSLYKDTLARAERLDASGLAYVDVGTSGGVWGKAEGYSMMVGGAPEAVERLRPALESLAPAADQGWGHVGPSGSGHFVKMVHNGVEYGLMQAYAEGFALMQRKEDFGLDLAQIAQIWRHGSVVRSWLLDLTAQALDEDAGLEGVAPWVPDSGEGRWTVFEAIDLDCPAPVISLALIERLNSRDKDSYTYKLLSAMRNKFGGHAIKREGDQ